MYILRYTITYGGLAAVINSVCIMHTTAVKEEKYKYAISDISFTLLLSKAIRSMEEKKAERKWKQTACRINYEGGYLGDCPK